MLTLNLGLLWSRSRADNLQWSLLASVILGDLWFYATSFPKSCLLKDKLCCLRTAPTEWEADQLLSPLVAQAFGWCGHFASFHSDFGYCWWFLFAGKARPKMEEGKNQNTGQTGAGVSKLQWEGCGRVFYTYPQEWSCTHPLTHLTLRSIMSFSYLESDIAAGFGRMICKCSQSHLIRAPASLYHLSNKADGFGQQTCR